MPTIEVGNSIAGAGGGAIQAFALGSPALGNTSVVRAAITDNTLAAVTDAALAAVTDDGTQQTISTGFTQPAAGRYRVVTATAGGTAGDIKAIQVTINGTDSDGAVQQEVLDAFTVNTTGTVTGSLEFATITSVVIPAHDGTGATTEIGYGATASVTQTITTGITNPAVCRNLTATSGGTAGDIKAVQVTVAGTNINDEAITETLPIFTVNSATTVVGSKAFKTVTSISVPGMDGSGATVIIGTGAKLGLPVKRTRDSVIRATFNGVRESTHPTVVFDADEVEKNMVTLSSTLDGSPVIIDLY